MSGFDVAIVGLGAMGSLTALELARRGLRVIGFDRFRPPHSFGSSHGRTRIIREAYFEHPQYVPLVRRAYESWAALERASGRQLLLQTGGLMLGPPEGQLLAGARRSAVTHGLAFRELPPEAVREQFPVFRLRAHEAGLFEPRAGILFPEAAIEAALALAAAAGVELRLEEPVEEWTAGKSLVLTTGSGTYSVRQVILSAGAWLAGPLARTALPLRVARQTLFWFDPAPDPLVRPERMPIFIWEWTPGRMFYGFPDLGDGVKLAIHHEGADADPDRVVREAAPSEAAELLSVVNQLAPRLGGPLRESAVCLYTNTPDGDFILDRHPDESRVLIASPCSGHGFKFAPAIAEVLADRVEGKPARFDLAPFALARFGGLG